MITLKTALATYGHTKALKDGSLSPKRAKLEFEEFTPQSAAFKAMVPEAKLDLVEMVISHYVMARDHGYPFIGIPVFPVRQFHHSAVTVNTKAGVTTPKDLEGKKVGVRTYGFSRGIWARAALALEYGVDLGKVTWVVDEKEAVPEYTPPANVEINSGGDMAKQFQSGEIAGGIGVAGGDSPDIKPLIENASQAEAASFKATGVYPMSHILVLRSSLAEEDPELPIDLFNAFKEAKARLLAEIDSGAELAGGDKATAAARAIVGPDPLPYGVEANRKTLEMAVEQAHLQGFTRRRFSVEELFVPSTLKLT
ncbi:MAG: ABC transporter substrate-binding protein [Dehalococcoidia bacterium]|nr:ABC transporter substrate-binding protein [Dehalococcoidia bacterium]